MCQCNPKIEEHVLYQITPVVDGVLFGVKLHCDGTLEIVGEFDPNNGDQMMLLWKELAEDLPLRSCFPLLRVQEGVHLEQLTHYVIDPIYHGQPEVNVLGTAKNTPHNPIPEEVRCRKCDGNGSLGESGALTQCTACEGTGVDPRLATKKGTPLKGTPLPRCRECNGVGGDCELCGGTGIDPRLDIEEQDGNLQKVLSPDSPDCSICQGSGTILIPGGTRDACMVCSGTGKDLTEKCHRCKGTGETSDLSHTCGRCKGSGAEPVAYDVKHG
jgi:hypothetical protein